MCDVFGINKEAVDNVRSHMLDHQLVAYTAEIFKVLGDPTRMRLLHALAQRELCVCDLSAVLGMTQSAISHQLRDIRSARLVRYRKAGKIVFYTLADAARHEFIEVGVDHAPRITATVKRAALPAQRTSLRKKSRCGSRKKLSSLV